MGEPAMVGESVNRAFETGEHVEIWRLGGERHGCRGQRRLAVKSRTSENSSGQEVGDGFQTKVLTQMWPSKLAIGINDEGHEVTRRKPSSKSIRWKRK